MRIVAVWFLKFKRRLQDPISTHVAYNGLLYFFPELALGKKRKGRPLYASHDISPREKTNTSPGRVDGGLHKSPVSGTKGEKTVKTSSSCVFGRKRKNGHVKDPWNAPRICPLRPPDRIHCAILPQTLLYF